MSNTNAQRSELAAALPLLLSLFLGACGGEDSPSGDGGTGSSGSGGRGGSGGSGGTGSTSLPDPCTLTTPAELGPIVGITLARSELIRGLTGDPSCTWYDANDYAVFQLGLSDDHIPYDFSASQADSVPLSGIGDEAHLGNLYAVHVRKGTRAFFTQAMDPVADGEVSTEVESAASAEMMPYVLQYEAAFRFAELVIDDL